LLTRGWWSPPSVFVRSQRPGSVERLKLVTQLPYGLLKLGDRARSDHAASSCDYGICRHTRRLGHRSCIPEDRTLLNPRTTDFVAGRGVGAICLRIDRGKIAAGRAGTVQTT
jgi:hypothetical protein